MILKKINLCQIISRYSGRKETLLTNYKGLLATKHSIKNVFISQMTTVQYRFSQTRQNNPPISQTKITFEIEKANSSQQIRSILNKYSQSINFIHRTVMLQKVTQRPFDQDQQLVEQVVSSIKANWKNDYCEPIESNSRAIANTICYMSRKKKFHHLDAEFAQIDYSELAKHLNPKQFVMSLNGLLKLQLTDKIHLITKGKFSLQNFIRENVNEKFFPSLLVSMWFNLLKYQKSSQTINNFFSQLLKNKHFKSNLIDYMQIVYCYVNSEGQRSIDLTYPVLTHPKELNPKTFIGAHELSVLYEQLAKLKKIKDIYFSEQFTEVLETCYIKILNEGNVPLRNVANVFNSLVQYENPTSKILDATYHKYFTVMKTQIALLQKAQPNRKPRTNVDSLSFVSLFNQLLQHYQSSNKYLNQMVTISMSYIEKIVINQVILKQYNQRTFIRLLSGIDLAKKMVQQKNQPNSFSLTKLTKSGLERQIMKRNFTEVSHLGKLMNFVYNHDIRSKEICQKFKKLIDFIPNDNQTFSAFQERLKQNCILNKNCKNCANCFSK